MLLIVSRQMYYRCNVDSSDLHSNGTICNRSLHSNLVYSADNITEGNVVLTNHHLFFKHSINFKTTKSMLGIKIHPKHNVQLYHY